MANTLKLKRSATAGAIPSTASLQLGELAVNTYDGRLFMKRNAGSDAIAEFARTDQTMYLGTTAVNINRASAPLALTGITSIDGSAAKWTTARTLTIGNTGKPVDGLAAVSWSLAEIGALPLSGGTLTGDLTAPKLISTVATGVAPLTVASTTVCTNLNADSVDGAHYATDTFTPVLRDGASGTAATAATALGRYVKMGRLVQFWISLIDINTTGLTAGNQVYITGLFHASTNTGSYIALHSVLLTNVSSATSVSAYQTANDKTMRLFNNTATGVSNFTVSQLTSGSADVYITGSYFTD